MLDLLEVKYKVSTTTVQEWKNVCDHAVKKNRGHAILGDNRTD